MALQVTDGHHGHTGFAATSFGPVVEGFRIQIVVSEVGGSISSQPVAEGCFGDSQPIFAADCSGRLLGKNGERQNRDSLNSSTGHRL